jgi:phosphate transport system substrate-binding protein
MNRMPDRPRTARRLSPPQRVGMLVCAITAIMAALWPSLGPGVVPAAAAGQYTRISGDGSSWAANALSQWTADVSSQGVTIDYNPDGSSLGRGNFARGLSDFAVSEIPYKGDTADPQDSTQPPANFAMLPVVAGGTSFMYNVPVNGQRYTGLKLTQSALAKIFAGEITMWDDPALKATNPGVNLPHQRITVVVRSEGSGATAQFTLWMKRQFPNDYAALCAKTGCNPANATSYYPYQGLSNFVAQNGSNGVTTYTANTPYTIGYDEYSYALGVQFPVAQIQNAAGFYTIPTDTAVAVALTQAKINTDKSSPNYLTQDLSNVYAYKDPRTYPISMYTYMLVPTATTSTFSAAKGATLAYFNTYALCEGQRTMGPLGYSPLPMNLVLAAMDQVSRIPGIDAPTQQTIATTKASVANSSGNPCNNPTFKPGDSPAINQLVKTAPFPAGCDAACQAPWSGDDAAVNPNAPGGGKKPNKGGNHPTQGDSQSPTSNPTSTSSTGPTTSNSSGTNSGSGTGNNSPSGPQSVSTGGPAAAACDADTGVCAQPNTTNDGTQLVANPTVIDNTGTWGIAQVALVISVLLGLLLVFAPPIASRLLEARAATPRRTPAGGEGGPVNPAGPGSPGEGAGGE